MPRARNPIPSYRRHKQSGQAVVTVRTATGQRRDMLLGPYGSEESKAEYARVVAEFRAAASPPPAGKRLTVAELLVAFRSHAERYSVRPDGTPSGEYREYALVIRVVRQLYAHTLAADFGPGRWR